MFLFPNFLLAAACDVSGLSVDGSLVELVGTDCVTDGVDDDDEDGAEGVFDRIIEDILDVGSLDDLVTVVVTLVETIVGGLTEVVT